MTAPRKLAEVPAVTVEVVRDKTAEGGEGFLRVRRLELVTKQADGTRSRPFAYDVIERRAIDASVMLAHHVEGGQVHVWVRSAMRPPLALRTLEPRSSGVLWEVPAGLVEPGESPRAAAARELAEELGFHVDETSMLPLGGWTAPCPAFMGEMHHFFHVRVAPETRREPAGDGSPLEEAAACVALPLADLLEACTRGEIRDAKTELGLRRFAEIVRA